MNVTPYPPILKSADWQKEKSIIAKVLPGNKTGIGEALAECEKLYPEFKQAITPAANPKQLTEPMKRAAAKFALALQHAREQAKAAAEKWSARTSPVPKTTRIHAENIYKAARDYFNYVDQMV